MFDLRRLKAFADAPLPEVPETSTSHFILGIIQGWMEAVEETEDCQQEGPDLLGLAGNLLEVVRPFRDQAEVDSERPSIASLFGTIRRGIGLHIEACELLATSMDEGDIEARHRVLDLVAEGDVHLARARVEIKRCHAELARESESLE